MLWSTKGLLPVLWQRYEHDPVVSRYLLPAFFADDPRAAELSATGFARKPLLGREGNNIELVAPGGEVLARQGGRYGADGWVVQQLCPLPDFPGPDGPHHPVLGAWVVDGEPAGLGIRESDGLITDNLSYFVPHTIDYVSPRAGGRVSACVRVMRLEGEYEPSPRQWVRDQVERYEATGGREGNTLRDSGLPIAIFWNRGVRSGKIRKTPLMRVEHDGVYAMVGSVGGAPRDPAWVANVRAHPQVTVQDGPEPWDGVAREITGEEKDEWWARAVAAFPPYAQYQEKTDRAIPVFLVERAGEDV